MYLLNDVGGEERSALFPSSLCRLCLNIAVMSQARGFLVHNRQRHNQAEKGSSCSMMMFIHRRRKRERGRKEWDVIKGWYISQTKILIYQERPFVSLMKIEIRNGLETASVQPESSVTSSASFPFFFFFFLQTFISISVKASATPFSSEILNWIKHHLIPSLKRWIREKKGWKS